MFSDVVQYVDYAVRCVERHEGQCCGSRLLEVLGYCARTYASLGTVRGYCVCGSSSGFYALGDGDVRRVGGVPSEVGETGGEVTGDGGGITTLGSRCVGDAAARRCGDAGLVGGAASVPEVVRGEHRGSDAVASAANGVDVGVQVSVAGSVPAEALPVHEKRDNVCAGVPGSGAGGGCGGVLDRGAEVRVPDGGVRSGQGEYSKVDGRTVPTAASLAVEDGVAAFSRGKHFRRNLVKRQKAKHAKLSGQWRRVDGSGGCISDESVTGTVRTVDTRTGVEIEAAQTLAARRVVENQVATELARHKLKALADESRTEAVNRLAAARYEKQINQAKAASQRSFKQCDESLKSLGSAGSAGEFALKQAVKDARDNEKVHKYTQRQLALTLRYASDDVKRMVSELPPPEFEDELDVFGDCPSDYDDDQRESYYMEINRRNRECGDVDRSPVGVTGTTRNEYFDLEMLREKHRLGLFLTEKELVALEMAAAAAS